MTQNGLKHILNRSLKIMEFDTQDSELVVYRKER